MFKESTIEDIYTRLGIDNLKQPLQSDISMPKQQIMRYDDFLKNFGVYPIAPFKSGSKTS